MKYPKYKWKDDLRRKITRHQIRKIKKLCERGIFLYVIADMFGVTPAAISYVLTPLCKKKISNRLKYLRYRDSYFKFDRNRRKEIRRRKRFLQLNRIRKYYRIRSVEYRRRKRLGKGGGSDGSNM